MTLDATRPRRSIGSIARQKTTLPLCHRGAYMHDYLGGGARRIITSVLFSLVS